MSLNDIMDFDHIVEVHTDGSITDGPANLYAPSLYDGDLDDSRWELLTGYSGQYGYSGPIMHNSEYIGGGMERDILSTPGVYVALVCYWSPDEESTDDEHTIEGWAVAHYIGEGK